MIGFADFILAVGTGLTLNAINAPAMSNIADLPLCVIPLFGVPITGAIHLIMLDRLFARRTDLGLSSSTISTA